MSTPDESTLSPEKARRTLAESRSARRHTDSIVRKAEATFDQSRAIGERNGFVEELKKLLRGVAA